MLSVAGHRGMVGSGTPQRELLYFDDLDDACVHPLERGYDVPLPTGKDLTISKLAEIVMPVVGFSGRIVFDAVKPDGTPRRLLDVNRLAALRRCARTGLRDGIARVHVEVLQRRLT